MRQKAENPVPLTSFWDDTGMGIQADYYQRGWNFNLNVSKDISLDTKPQPSPVGTFFEFGVHWMGGGQRVMQLNISYI